MLPELAAGLHAVIDSNVSKFALAAVKPDQQ